MTNPLDPAPRPRAVPATAVEAAVPDPSRAAHARLEKRFGNIEVLRGLDWDVPAGRVLGLLGRNGAGKSTLIRCLLGISPIDAGRVDVLGAPVAELGGKRLHRIGYVPQSFDLFPWMKVKSYLAFTRAFYPRWDEALVTRLLADWDINRKQKIGQLSRASARSSPSCARWRPIPTC
jgi:ABC-2 type transport system ATP-binding protein